MIYVVVTELLPHSQKTNSWWGTGGVLGGFAIMMTLDTSFG
jgi:zinc transporter ZupT